ncbi:hypothetical protein L1049_007925 [Liquidambar formosana]|uniref:Uncharacterized protein n=1 Tax=Liquidambar formosana TaxID=63359 RepID=A0AAP0X484_LIQFO
MAYHVWIERNYRIFTNLFVPKEVFRGIEDATANRKLLERWNFPVNFVNREGIMCFAKCKWVPLEVGSWLINVESSWTEHGGGSGAFIKNQLGELLCSFASATVPQIIID